MFLGKYFLPHHDTSDSAMVFNTSDTTHCVWCALSDRCLETSQDAWHTLVCLAFINPLLSSLFSSPFPPCFSPLFSENEMLTEWKQIVQGPFEHSTLILGLLATCLHVWLTVEGLSCAANESSTFLLSSLCFLPGGSGDRRFHAVLSIPARLCSHFSWPPVSSYLHLHFPGFGEQSKHSQPSAGTRNVTISLVLINKHASLSLPHSCSLAPQGST